MLVEETEAKTILSAALDGVGRLVAVVDAGLNLYYANAPARTAFAEGSVLRLGSGRLFATPPGADERLRSVVRRTAGSDGAGGIVLLRSGRRAEIVRIRPLRTDQNGPKRALALILGSHRLSLVPADLRTAYGFTAREAELALLFANGCGIGEAAARLRRSVNTVKTAARAIYAKLEVKSHAAAGARIQAELSS